MITDLLTRDRLADRRGGVWDYVSPSRLNLWLKCPLAFRLRYLDGVKTPTSRSLFIGKVVHSALECFYRHRQLGLLPTPADLSQRLIESWSEAAAEDAVSFESTEDEAESCNQAISLVRSCLAQIPADEPKPLAVEVAVEAPLVDPASGEDLGIPLVGILDLALPEVDGPEIIDFKTAARGGEPLEIAHEIQLSSYSYLFRYTSRQEESALEIRQLVKTEVPKIGSRRAAAVPKDCRTVLSIIASPHSRTGACSTMPPARPLRD